jgi:hypothetical protein
MAASAAVRVVARHVDCCTHRHALGNVVSFALALATSTALASGASPPAICAGCTLDAPAHGDAIPLLVVLRDATDATGAAQPLRAPALREGWAVLSLAGWEHTEPRWLEDQVLAAARQHPIDLARVYLVGAGNGAAHIAQHVQAVSETFAAIAITGGGGRPVKPACPDEVLPAYFSVDAGDPRAIALKAYLDRCRQPVLWTASRGALDQQTAITILAWLHRHRRVTTVA